jgi:hypothetical protein
MGSLRRVQFVGTICQQERPSRQAAVDASAIEYVAAGRVISIEHIGKYKLSLILSYHGVIFPSLGIQRDNSPGSTSGVSSP